MKMILTIVFIFSLFIMINGQANCSMETKCGSNGYCYEQDNETLCECKFWMEGELCNRQSDNGKQVIALGCITGILIFMFYGLSIGRKIYIKYKKPKEKEIEEILPNPKLLHVAVKHVKKLTPLSSIIITIFVILVATGTLLAKWSLLQSIHNDIVAKYKAQQPVYFTRKSVCNVFDAEAFNIATFPVACLLVIICIVVTKRVSLMRNKCYGYIAPPMPIDFFLHLDRKFAAVIFAIIADELLDILKEIFASDSSDGILVKFLLRVFKVLIMGFRYYPILACVHINTKITLICATLYAWLDYSCTIVSQGMCNPDYYPSEDDYQNNNDTNIEEYLSYYGVGSKLVAIQLCTDIPRFLCLAYVSVKLPMMLIEKIRDHRKTNMSDENKMLISLTREEKILLRICEPDSVDMLYVRNLLRSADQRPRSQALFARLIPLFIYEWRDDFRFSTRVLCVYSSVFLLLFFVTIRAIVEVIPVLNDIQSALQDIVNTFASLFSTLINTFQQDTSTDPVPITFPVPNLVDAYICAVAMTVTIIVVQLIVLLVNIRRNLFQVYRGEDSEIPRRKRARYVSYATGNFHFAGYFIGFFIWGFIIIAIFSTLVCICLGAFIQYGSVRALEKILKACIPSILLILFKLFINKFLAQYVFLQHCGDVLALNNRRFFMIFIFFNFFLDAFLGFVSSILRLIASVIGGILYMCRLDYSTLGRKLETFDSGFNAYCGFIHTECTHRHPIMLVFVSHLFSEIRKKQYAMGMISTENSPIHEKYLMQQKKSLRYIRKWRLAAFLVRNPAIVFLRKGFLKNLRLEDLRAINDVDNDDHISTQRRVSFYTRQMAAQRPGFMTDIDATQIIIQRF